MISKQPSKAVKTNPRTATVESLHEPKATTEKQWNKSPSFQLKQVAMR